MQTGCLPSKHIKKCVVLRYPSYLSKLCITAASTSTSQVSLDGLTASSQNPNHVRPAKLHCCWTVSVKQSSSCSMETRHDAADPGVTTEDLLCCTSNMLTNRSDIHHRPALLRHFCDSSDGYKTPYLLTHAQQVSQLLPSLTLDPNLGHQYESAWV